MTIGAHLRQAAVEDRRKTLTLAVQRIFNLTDSDVRRESLQFNLDVRFGPTSDGVSKISHTLTTKLSAVTCDRLDRTFDHEAAVV